MDAIVNPCRLESFILSHVKVRLLIDVTLFESKTNTGNIELKLICMRYLFYQQRIYAPTKISQPPALHNQILQLRQLLNGFLVCYFGSNNNSMFREIIYIYILQLLSNIAIKGIIILLS